MIKKKQKAQAKITEKIDEKTLQKILVFSFANIIPNVNNVAIKSRKKVQSKTPIKMCFFNFKINRSTLIRFYSPS